MSILKKFRERHNLSQEELSERSGISVRTIQRIESGIEPKGQTLKILAQTLGINEYELLGKEEIQILNNTTLLKAINLSSLPFIIIPPVNIIVPLIIMLAKKQFDPLARQIISIQFLWAIMSVIIFMISSLMKNWFSLGSKFILIIMILLILANVIIILVNAFEIDKNKKLLIKLNFSII